jgi:histone H2A
LDERRKNKKARKEGQKNNKKEENIFPYFRILKTMKRSGAMRVQKASAIFLSAVLEHVTTKLLELAGDECKSQRKHKITPLILKDCLRNDE